MKHTITESTAYSRHLAAKRAKYLDAKKNAEDVAKKESDKRNKYKYMLNNHFTDDASNGISPDTVNQAILNSVRRQEDAEKKMKLLKSPSQTRGYSREVLFGEDDDSLTAGRKLAKKIGAERKYQQELEKLSEEGKKLKQQAAADGDMKKVQNFRRSLTEVIPAERRKSLNRERDLIFNTDHSKARKAKEKSVEFRTPGREKVSYVPTSKEMAHPITFKGKKRKNNIVGIQEELRGMKREFDQMSSRQAYLPDSEIKKLRKKRDDELRRFLDKKRQKELKWYTNDDGTVNNIGLNQVLNAAKKKWLDEHPIDVVNQKS